MILCDFLSIILQGCRFTTTTGVDLNTLLLRVFGRFRLAPLLAATGTTHGFASRLAVMGPVEIKKLEVGLGSDVRVATVLGVPEL